MTSTLRARQAASAQTQPPVRSRRWVRLAFGAQPRWVRPSAAALLTATGFLYLWNLANSGYGNSFYAAAVQAGSKDWVALLFGSLDAGNAITVDKPPAALWIPGLFVRIFGFSSFTMLLPQAVMGVAAVGVLYLAVKRVSGPAAGLIAGGVLAATPVAALMFRFNNPDAMLTLCLVLAAYCTVRAVEKASWRWLAAAGALIGLAFLTKMLQGVLIVPALALAYLWAAPATLGKRLAHLGAALAGIVAVAGSYLLVFQLTPASVRPYMAGSENNSFLELTFGYNGLGRIFGGTGNGGGMGGGNTGFGGSPGLLRMFGAAFGTEVSWLLPAALLMLAAGLWFTRRAARTDRVRASLVIWGGWTLITAAVFSFMGGTIHPYYAVALAPGIAALAGIGAVQLWRGRAFWPARLTLAAAVLAAGLWGAVLLGRDASWVPGLKFVVIALAALAAAGLLLRLDRRRAGAMVLVAAALLAGGLGSTAYAVATAAVGHTGSIPVSGPSGRDSMGGFGGMANGRGGLADAPAGGPAGGGPQDASASAELTALLKAAGTKWSAIVSGAPSAARLELATGTNVIALGGWNGGDPYPTLKQFKEMVADGQIGYFIAGGMGGPGGRGGNSEVAQYVAENFEAMTVGGSTVYKLARG
ncbi:glycosyltransferase family 39 protein [Arthrobacter sp. I2-34]|uniref:Glycosyltransferase family 39 protein n=1 Tax=Arthrobacter hankyongi TaxID=2904801 RepID=A0ABS9L3W9_9MICC|nr:glycosyltransferase family 39 protein [Arthrobacter hankyongi]MCG2621187.1 glycosyltransferase family 39 protein [Arthrobacter hankyongi]